MEPTKNLLRKVEIAGLIWAGNAIDAWLPVDEMDKPVSPAVIFIGDMPPSLQEIFMVYLSQRQGLSIAVPGLPVGTHGKAYFAEDVAIAMDAALCKLPPFLPIQ